MTDLSEYIGHLVNEITRSRVIADRETVRIAQEYASDEDGLLRHFPAPRMRLPSLEITLPVVVSDIPDGYAEITSTEPKVFAFLVYEKLAPVLAEKSIQFDFAAVTKIVLSDPLLAKGRLAADLADTLSARIAHQIVDAEQVKDDDPKNPPPLSPEGATKRFIEVAAVTREPVTKVIAALPRRPASIGVDGRTATIKAVGDMGMVVHIKMIVTEESMEILLEPPTEDDPKKQLISQLVPE